MPVHSATLNGRQLAELLAEAIPFAHTDGTLPALYGIQLEARHGWITATATDRYILGQTRRPTEADTPCDLPEFLVPLDVAKELHATCKKLDHYQSVTLTYTCDDTAVATLVAVIAGDQRSFKLDSHNKFPAIGSLATNVPTAEVATPVVMGAEHLAKLVKVARKKPIYFYVYGPGKILHFSIGDRIRGSHMTIKLGSDTELTDSPTVPWGIPEPVKVNA